MVAWLFKQNILDLELLFKHSTLIFCTDGACGTHLYQEVVEISATASEKLYDQLYFPKMICDPRIVALMAIIVDVWMTGDAPLRTRGIPLTVGRSHPSLECRPRGRAGVSVNICGVLLFKAMIENKVLLKQTMSSGKEGTACGMDMPSTILNSVKIRQGSIRGVATEVLWTAAPLSFGTQLCSELYFVTEICQLSQRKGKSYVAEILVLFNTLILSCYLRYWIYSIVE